SFFRYFFKSPEFIARLAVAVIGIRDGKQISFKDFSALAFRCPPIEEQIAIGKCLSKADEEITLLQQKLDAFKAQKKGLMQQLLTGEIRVKL
ncbi:MAG: restriction endonuclease subunit S, partial [Phaeodactylibacter sp.]|nr:restriction endonuclease subunit S [Phaeodactylibacter sp.]